MRMFDSHCHLDASDYDRDREAVIARARAAGVTGILVPGYEPSEWQTLKAFCSLDPMLCCAVGLHPWYVHELDAETRVRALAQLADSAVQAGAVAIGECGLDAKRAKGGGADLDLQSEVLAAHLRVARELGLPIVLHCVGAHARLLELLARFAPLPAGGVLHSYGGSRELIRDYARYALSFSFAGIITRDEARRPHEALRAVPSDRLLLESDGPDQAPQGVHPGRTEPAHVALVVAAAARLRGEPADVVAQVTCDNARRLFSRAAA